MLVSFVVVVGERWVPMYPMGRESGVPGKSGGTIGLAHQQWDDGPENSASDLVVARGRHVPRERVFGTRLRLDDIEQSVDGANRQGSAALHSSVLRGAQPIRAA